MVFYIFESRNPLKKFWYVVRHPLFPLLALLFERCEQATQSAETPNSESFNLDIQAFVQHQERDRKPFLSNDSEVDGLVRKFCYDYIVFKHFTSGIDLVHLILNIIYLDRLCDCLSSFSLY